MTPPVSKVNKMNTKELGEYARLRGLNLGQAEKDYYQNILLFLLYGSVSKELVFKGGTALSKCYGLNRFSEDLDFTVLEERDFIIILEKGLGEFGILHMVKEEKTAAQSKKYRLKVQGPLYRGLERTLCSITLDFSFREKVLSPPLIKTIGHHMDIIPVFDVYVMSQNEILAEKIRALLARKSARDLYDIVFLLRNGAVVDEKMIRQKLALCGMEFDRKTFISRCGLLEGIWESELKSLVKNVPSFKEYVGMVKGKVER